MPFLKSPGLNRLARALAVLLALAVVVIVVSCVQRKKDARPYMGSSKSMGPP